MILKKCPNCKEYNLTDTCKSCKSKTQLAGYKFIKLRDESEIHPKFLSFTRKNQDKYKKDKNFAKISEKINHHNHFIN